MADLAVEVEGLCKVYRVYRSPWERLWEALLRRPRHRSFGALQDINFGLPRGQGLAILGENGAGKSTLLKILAGIANPSSGRVAVRGKIASILELGSGFHPEFTGRQNIVLNAAMLGLGEKELQAKLPTIVEWSELGDFIDQPVKVYSTGMAMRLGFSIATQVEPDVLIIDEALSVGDGYFQKKCMDRLLEFVGAGGTLLFCSHAMYYASAFCQRALWLRNGRVEALGEVSDVVRSYENFLLAKSARAQAASSLADPDAARGGAAAVSGGAGTVDAASAAAGAEAAGGSAARGGEDQDAPGRGPARIVAARVVGGARSPYVGGEADAAGSPAEAAEPPVFDHDDTLAVEIEWEAADPSLSFHVGVGINRIDEVEVCALATHLDGRAPVRGGAGGAIRLVLPKLPLVKGEFTLYVFLLDESGLHIYDQRIYRRAFGVRSAGYAFGLITADHRWEDVEEAAVTVGGVRDEAGRA